MEGMNMNRDYLHGAGIDEPVMVRFDGTDDNYYLPNIQGSIIALIDDNGDFTATYRYDAWGQILQSNGIRAQDNTYLYTGREYDWDTGIYYYRARSYNAEYGRFMQRDPAEMVDGPDMYEYVGGDPVNGVDPEGTGWYVFSTRINLHNEWFFQIIKYKWEVWRHTFSKSAGYRMVANKHVVQTLNSKVIKYGISFGLGIIIGAALYFAGVSAGASVIVGAIGTVGVTMVQDKLARCAQLRQYFYIQRKWSIPSVGCTARLSTQH